MNRGRRIFRALLVALIFATWAFVSVGSASAADKHVYPGQSIQTAINSAGIGDTIYVYAGTYVENVNVTKQLALIGVGKPVIDAGAIGSAITLSHDGIVLDGFTAINASSWPQAGIFVSSNNNIVINNTASNNSAHGILLDYSSNNTLAGNTASNNYFTGIYLGSSDNNTLAGNTANSNYNFGILMASSDNNTLAGNTANSNYNFGILMASSSDNTLAGNTANSNYNFGILMASSSDNTLTGNTATSNTNFGIYLGSSSDNTLTGNSANSNNYFTGIYLGGSSNNTLTGNTANSNNVHGIYLGGSSNNTLTGNTASNNNHYGIHLEQGSNNNHIYNNYFDNAINAYDDGTNIWNISKTLGTNIIGGPNLGGNYWSDYTGEDLGDDGLGDTQLSYNSLGSIVNGGDWLPLVKKPPAEFTDVYTDYGEDTNGDGLYDYLVIDIGVNMREAGFYDVSGYLYKNNDTLVDFASKTTYLNEGNQVAKLRFSGLKIRDTEYNGSFDLKYLSLSIGGEVSVIRDLPDEPVYPGDEIRVTLSQSGFFIDVGIVTELLPPGFSYRGIDGSGGKLKEYDPATNTLVINFLGVPNVTYRVKTGTADQIEDAVFSGTWKTLDFGLNTLSGDIQGDTTLTLGTGPTPTPTLTPSNGGGGGGDGGGGSIIDSREYAYTTSYYLYTEFQRRKVDTGTPSNPYPGIAGTHNGSITPSCTITLTKLYTYSCPGTGGHTEYAALSYPNGTVIGEAHWNGYIGDWHNINFNNAFTLYANETYNYTIRTGSYPQIIHAHEYNATGGKITCTEFVDINGKRHEDWIPAIRLE
jgi:nitrous oxidase accessory protein